MATQKPQAKNRDTSDTSDAVDARLMAFAEQLGTLVGTVQAKTEGWLDREALGKQLTSIRDGASELLNQVSPTAVKRAVVKKAKPAIKAAKSAAKQTRGLVDAPGKRHRKPPPQVKVGKHASEPKARVIGNPGLKTGRRGGRAL